MSELITAFAAQYQLEPAQMKQTLLRTVFPTGQVGEEHLVMFVAVAKQYNLNPFTKEIFAFPGKGGGIQPIVSIDGWLSMINRQPTLDGLETEDRIEDGNLVAITARIYIKDRSKPVTVTEYMSECRRDTDVWRRWPARMLRHKAVIQAARYAFGFSGIMDEDEYSRMTGSEVVDVEAQVIEQAQTISDDQYTNIKALMLESKTDAAQFAKVCKVDDIKNLHPSKYDGAISLLNNKLSAMMAKEKTDG